MFGDDNPNNRFRLFCCVFLMLTFIYAFFAPSAYAAEVDNIVVDNASLYKTESGNLGFNISYNGVDYSVPTTYPIDSVSGLRFLVYYMGSSTYDKFEFAISDVDFVVMTDDSKGDIVSSATYERPLRFRIQPNRTAGTNWEHVINSFDYFYLDSWSYGHGIAYSNFTVKNSDGSVFFQRPPIPSILTGVNLTSPLIQILHLIPVILIVMVSYLALRKALKELLIILRGC